MSKIFKFQGPALLWALFIFIICNVNLGSIGESSMFFPGFDKLTHCGLFFVLVVFTSQGLVRKYAENFNYGHAVKALLTGIVYGALIEILQLYVFTWRSGDWSDLFCDAVGACMGTFSILVFLNATKYAKV